MHSSSNVGAFLFIELIENYQPVLQHPQSLLTLLAGQLVRRVIYVS
jgi:hypothetical protein